MSNAAEGSYVADQYLPGDLSTWQRRIEDLIAELRRPDLQPCSGFLYRKEAGQPLQACIDGVINEMAIRGGVPGAWTEYTDADDENVIFWDIEQPDRGGEEPFGLLFTDAPTVAMPEALFYHGLDVQDGQHIIDIMQCDPTFIRSVINGRHGLAMGTATTVKTNDSLVHQGANPLLVWADILTHLASPPNLGTWHPRIPEAAANHP